MGQDYSPAGRDHGQFDKTRWSMVLEAVKSQAPGGSEALAELCERYWRPKHAGRAEKRGGRAELIRLDWQDAETRLVFETEDRLTAGPARPATPPHHDRKARSAKYQPTARRITSGSNRRHLNRQETDDAKSIGPPYQTTPAKLQHCPTVDVLNGSGDA
jgi:hypothetical protein